MARRFTDTEKWKDEWYLGLSNDHKAIWQYLLDNCTPAGRFKKGYELLNFCCKTSITEVELIKITGERLLDCGNFFLIIKFLQYQYPKGLNSNKPAIISVRGEIEQYNLQDKVIKQLGDKYLDKRLFKSTKNTKPKELKPKPIKLDPLAQFSYLKNEQFSSMFKNYLEMRAKIKKPATDKAKEIILKDLHKYEIGIAVKMLENSVINSWQGVFPLKDNFGKPIQKAVKKPVEQPAPSEEDRKKLLELINNTKNSLNKVEG